MELDLNGERGRCILHELTVKVYKRTTKKTGRFYFCTTCGQEFGINQDGSLAKIPSKKT